MIKKNKLLLCANEWLILNSIICSKKKFLIRYPVFDSKLYLMGRLLSGASGNVEYLYITIIFGHL